MTLLAASSLHARESGMPLQQCWLHHSGVSSKLQHQLHQSSCIIHLLTCSDGSLVSWWALSSGVGRHHFSSTGLASDQWIHIPYMWVLGKRKDLTRCPWFGTNSACVLCSGSIRMLLWLWLVGMLLMLLLMVWFLDGFHRLGSNETNHTQVVCNGDMGSEHY